MKAKAKEENWFELMPTAVESDYMERWWDAYRTARAVGDDHQDADKVASSAVAGFYEKFPKLVRWLQERVDANSAGHASDENTKNLDGRAGNRLRGPQRTYPLSGPFGEFLTRNKLSAYRFAKMAMVSQSTVSRAAGVPHVCRGKVTAEPRLNVLMKLLAAAKALEPDLTGHALFGGLWDRAVTNRLRLPVVHPPVQEIVP